MKEKPKPLKLSKEEEILREKWTRLLEMVTKGRLDALKGFLEKESASLGGLDAQIPDWAGEKRASIMQLAVENGHEEMVRWLLEGRADPTIPVPASKVGEADEGESHKSDASESGYLPSSSPRRTAYDLARSKSMRDIFRRCAAAHPTWWDWLGAARVPSALSQEMEEGREEKKKVRRKGLKDRVKEREARDKDRPKTPPVEVIAEIKEEIPLNAKSRRLGGASGGSEGVAGLTPEMRAKVERERRARAAEARLKSYGGS